MNKLSPRIFFTKPFIRELRILRSWMDENVSPQKGRQFLLELDDFIIHKVAPYPSHFME